MLRFTEGNKHQLADPPPSPQSSSIAVPIPLGATLRAQVRMSRRGGAVSFFPLDAPRPVLSPAVSANTQPGNSGG